MRNNFTKIFVAAAAIFCFYSAKAQQSFFTDITEAKLKGNTLKRVIVPEKYRTVALKVDAITSFLKSVPSEQFLLNKQMAPVIDIPMPDGSTSKFYIWESAVMEPELAAKFPGIKTYTGQGITDPTAIIKMDMTELGFHAMILSSINGSVFIDPFAQGTTTEYISYNKLDFKGTNKTFKEFGLIKNNRTIQKRPSGNVLEETNPSQEINEQQPTEPIKADRKNIQRLTIDEVKRSKEQIITHRQLHRPAGILAGSCVGPTLRTYRLAIACTGEYAQAATGFANPTTAQALSAIVTSANRVDGVYERELAISLNLIANNDIIVFTNPATDPFTGNNNPAILIDESQNEITARIGNANFDIGHTFSSGGGGYASLGCVCVTGDKASGITGDANPVGDPYDIDFVAHEMGHQFGADHTFNATTGFCGGNTSSTSNTEPGSGSTIMSYAGLCNTSNNLQNNSDPQFQAISFDEITEYITNGAGASCAVSTSTGNNGPVVNAGANFIIPVSTPFILTGSATDADADALTYSWEQINTGGPNGNWNNPVGDAPIFRSFTPVAIPQRYFPKLTDVINNTTTIGEILPSYARTLKFRLTARDNKAGGGGVCYDTMSVVVANTGGAFAVTYPNVAGITWQAGETRTITWNVSGTSGAPINCANVVIQLSTDGGLTYPYTIVPSTPNDGTQDIVVPQNINTATARIRIIGLGNVFYDISNANFTIGDAQVDTCNFVSTDVPQPIPDIIDTDNGQGFTYSTITVPAELAVTITDVDVVGLTGTHTFINDIGVFLVGPSNDGVVLMDDVRDGSNNLCSADNFALNLDDEATTVTFPCPPVGNITVKPQEPLSIFDGQSSAGEWTLIIVDFFPSEDDGVLQNWGLRFCQSSVPVTWQTFTANRSAGNNNTVLSWSVTEYNNAYYEIERSIDGINFYKIGKVEASSVNNGRTVSYLYNDMKPVTGTNYYRLKQYDNDGKFTYSIIAKVDFEKLPVDWTIYPNPAKDKINIISNADQLNVQLQLFDAAGKMLYNNKVNNTTRGQVIPVTVSHLAKGVYSLKIITNGEKVKVNKIFIR